jgi:RNA polymerase sigma factor (sigma-70 family)
MARDLTNLPARELPAGALLERVARPADKQEFLLVAGELVDRYSKLVYAQALRFVSGDRHLADDVFQDTFVRLFKWLKERRGQQPLHSLAGLLRVLTRRAAIDLIRKRKPSEPLPDLAETEDLVTALYARELLETLESPLREVLSLTYLQGLPAVEIGRRLGLKPNHVRVLRSRALQRLRLRQGLDEVADSIDPL